MCEENSNNIIYSTILLPELLSSAILKSTPERNQRNQRCLRSVESARMLNVNNTDYVLGYSPKWQKTVTWGEELLNCWTYGWTPDVTWTILPMSLLRFCALIVIISLLSMEGQRALRFHQIYLNLSSEDEQRSYGFGTTWGWVINDKNFIFWWINPLRSDAIFQWRKITINNEDNVWLIQSS